MRTAEQLDRELTDLAKRILNMREDCRAYRAQGEEVKALLVEREIYGVRALYREAWHDYLAVTGMGWLS